MRNIVVIVCFCLFFSCKDKSEKKQVEVTEAVVEMPAKVVVNMEDGKYVLRVNNEPFYIKGAGLEFGNVPALASHNANSFRTWRTENGQKSGKEVLDEAHENGIMVTMGIEVGRERHGFDYDDP